MYNIINTALHCASLCESSDKYSTKQTKVLYIFVTKFLPSFYIFHKLAKYVSLIAFNKGIHFARKCTCNTLLMHLLHKWMFFFDEDVLMCYSSMWLHALWTAIIVWIEWKFIKLSNRTHTNNHLEGLYLLENPLRLSFIIA